MFRKDFRRIFGTAKGFASFGFFLVLYECMMEHMRVKDDGTNSFLAGFATSVVLGANSTILSYYSHDKEVIALVRHRRWIHDVRILQSLQMVRILIIFCLNLTNAQSTHIITHNILLYNHDCNQIIIIDAVLDRIKACRNNSSIHSNLIILHYYKFVC